MQESAKQRFLARLGACMEDGTFVKLTLGHPSTTEGARKLLLRPVVIRGEKCCSVVSRFATRDETKNIPFAGALELTREKLGAEFLSAHLFTESDDAQLDLGGRAKLRIVPAQREPAELGHDQARSRWVDAGARYLHALGVTDAHGKVRERMGDKFRQIERFVDLLASAYRESGLTARNGDPITMCDMGSGKGYLTFAAYDYFQRVEKRAVKITGVEARSDLVSLCNDAARECGFDGLEFVRSAIADYSLSTLDILVALHACDTATDDALFAGVRAGAEIILAAPCCHKEARPQVDAAVADNPLADVLRHGIYAERHAEMATDALRTLLLERAGYRVRVAEFVSPEHTAKNVMLIATRRPRTLAESAVAEINRRIVALKKFYGIKHQRLEHLLMA
ncbi:MAG TPA: SAM-dependent methyltransferase [Chthoniobacteraceae bacterium]|nr:SAM-dependent methyltransferase [Chthoniobacteraceae bacterium]